MGRPGSWSGLGVGLQHDSRPQDRLLVTISDQTNDPMFNIGSAVPRQEMVLAMAKIGKILADRKHVAEYEGRRAFILLRRLRYRHCA